MGDSGCTDSRAINYNENAITNDGSCSYIDSNGNAPNFAGYDPETGTLSIVMLHYG